MQTTNKAVGAMGSRVEPGSEIAGYRVLSALHTGGNGYVYAVSAPTGTDPGFPLIMKVPGLGPGEPALGLVSFEVEQMIHPTLTGPHVPRLVASGVAGKLPYIVMERIEGEGLEAVLAGAPLSPSEVARVGAALADAIHSLHQQHVVHLDIKPQNFILRPDGQAVLLDFGYAHHPHLPDLLAEEQHHAAGSASYVSVEQLQGQRTDPRSDIFALGAILFELATGEPPFGEPATVAGMRDRLWREPPPPRSLNAGIPAWLQEIILRALEVNAAERYPSAALVAFDLRHPDQVRITPRGERVAGNAFFAQARNWWRSLRVSRPFPAQRSNVGATPVILVAVDTEHPDDNRHRALQSTTKAILSATADFRVLFVSVIRAVRLGEGERLEDTASGKQLEHRNRLRHWVEPLRLPPARHSLHAVESPDPARTLLELARANNVDLVVIGAPGPSHRAFAWWRSVASAVTAQAHCSVYVVRVPEDDAAPDIGAGAQAL